MSNNIREFKTTIMGMVIWGATAFYFFAPYFHQKPLWEVNNVYVGIGLLSGLLLLLAPDRFVNFLFGWMKSRSAK